MKTTLNTYQIADALLNDENARWSRAGAYALAEYLEELEESTEEMELDVVAIRCDWSEYESLQAWAADYFAGDWREEIGISPDCMEEGISDIALDQIIRMFILDKNGGTLLEFDGGVIVSQF